MVQTLSSCFGLCGGLCTNSALATCWVICWIVCWQVHASLSLFLAGYFPLKCCSLPLARGWSWGFGCLWECSGNSIAPGLLDCYPKTYCLSRQVAGLSGSARQEEPRTSADRFTHWSSYLWYPLSEGCCSPLISWSLNHHLFSACQTCVFLLEGLSYSHFHGAFQRKNPCFLIYFISYHMISASSLSWKPFHRPWSTSKAPSSLGYSPYWFSTALYFASWNS